ncbi:MAG TPA: hypothetical protein DFS52_03820, partial [Myxococcales bacterium]|nr:hypothetical protein [Myxococcales bacterium]
LGAQPGSPTVTLGAAYKKIDDFDALFPAVPSLVDAEALNVEGRIRFDRPVRVRGRVTFRHSGEETVDLSALGRDVFENETVTL